MTQTLAGQGFVRDVAAECNNQTSIEVGVTGLERMLVISAETAFHEQGGAESGALTLDPDLLDVIEAWPTLPEPIKGALLTMVKHASPSGK